MHLLIRLSCVIGSILGLCCTAQAQLAWETTEQRVEVGWEQDVITAIFQFKNEGSYPLTLLRVEPTQKQLRATIGTRHKVVERGQAGTVTLSLPNRGVFGEMHYTATVKTDERSAPQVLVLHVVPEGWDAMDERQRAELAAEGERLRALPAPLDIEPRLVHWLPGETLRPKSVTVTVKSDEPVQVLGVIPIGGQTSLYDFLVITLKKGRKYEIKVTPRLSERNSLRPLGAWTLQTDMTDLLQKRQKVQVGSMNFAATTVRFDGARPFPSIEQ